MEAVICSMTRACVSYLGNVGIVLYLRDGMQGFRCGVEGLKFFWLFLTQDKGLRIAELRVHGRIGDGAGQSVVVRRSSKEVFVKESDRRSR